MRPREELWRRPLFTTRSWVRLWAPSIKKKISQKRNKANMIKMSLSSPRPLLPPLMHRKSLSLSMPLPYLKVSPRNRIRLSNRWVKIRRSPMIFLPAWTPSGPFQPMPLKVSKSFKRRMRFRRSLIRTLHNLSCRWQNSKNLQSPLLLREPPLKIHTWLHL